VLALCMSECESVCLPPFVLGHFYDGSESVEEHDLKTAEPLLQQFARKRRWGPGVWEYMFDDSI
jgi:hypothetical protein